MVALMLGMMLVVSVPVAILQLSGVDMLSGTGMLVSQALTQVLCFALPAILMVIIYYRKSAREFVRLRFDKQRWLYGLAGVVALLLLLPAIDWLSVWNDEWNLGRVGELLRSLQNSTEGLLDGMLGTTTVGGLLANLLVVAVLPAMCEELFFRVGMQNLLQRWFGGNRQGQVGTHVAIWVTAVIFSLGHGEVFAFMPRLLMGVLLGYLYIYGGSVVVNMLAHFVNNAIVVVLYWLVARGVLDIDPEAPMRCDFALTACCTLAAVAVMWVTFFKKSAPKKGENTPAEGI